MPGKRAREAASSVEDQARGTSRNVRSFFSSFALDEALPPSIAGFIQNLLMLFPRALGSASPRQQVYSSTALILIAIITTPFTLGWSIFLALPFVLTLLVGFARMIPAVNSGFNSARGTKLRDRDVPLWKRD